MFIHNESELKTNTNTPNGNHIHIINRSSGKNCSTSSTDSGVGLGENGATFRTNRESHNSKAETEGEVETKPQRISIEVEAKVNLNKDQVNQRRSSPTVSIRSTTISIVSIDENAIDSSCIDSDSEAEPEEGCTVQKLGRQVACPPHNPELTELNKGLTVISRQVVPGTSQVPPPVPEPDVVAQQVLNGNMNLATPTTPASPQQQIGSIALNNTTDVTFGDKHYYEGPVTIQQILIDSRDKWKAGDGQDNPAFDAHSSPNGSAPGEFALLFILLFSFLFSLFVFLLHTSCHPSSTSASCSLFVLPSVCRLFVYITHFHSPWSDCLYFSQFISFFFSLFLSSLVYRERQQGRHFEIYLRAGRNYGKTYYISHANRQQIYECLNQQLFGEFIACFAIKIIAKVFKYFCIFFFFVLNGGKILR